jgi:hypothetical protein
MVAPKIMLALTDLPEDLHLAWSCSFPVIIFCHINKGVLKQSSMFVVKV